MKILKNNFSNQHDLIIWGVGYESRGCFISTKFCQRTDEFALGYSKNKGILCFDENVEHFQARGADLRLYEDSELESFLSSEFFKKAVIGKKDVMVDISSMTRKRIAMVVISLIENMVEGSKLTVCYAPSSYVKPPIDHTPINAFGPLHHKLIGKIGDLSKPSALILCLGYELGKATGIFNYLDCEENFVLYPRSSVLEFEEKVIENNQFIFDSVQKTHVFSYSLESPLLTYALIKDVVTACIKNFRPIIVPLGPKIVTVLSVLIGLEVDEAPVWRVSSEHTEVPVDRKPNGKILSFTILK